MSKMHIAIMTGDQIKVDVKREGLIEQLRAAVTAAPAGEHVSLIGAYGELEILFGGDRSLPAEAAIEWLEGGWTIEQALAGCPTKRVFVAAMTEAGIESLINPVLGTVQ